MTLAPAGERSHLFIVPRNHVTAGQLAYKGYLDAEGKAWPRIIFGDVEFRGYDEAWDLLNRPAHRARWGMADWVAEALVEHERDDIFAAITDPSTPARLTERPGAMALRPSHGTQGAA